MLEVKKVVDIWNMFIRELELALPEEPIDTSMVGL